MAKVRVENATWEHASELARVMRRQDREECQALKGVDPERALLDSIHLSRESWAAYIGGEIACLFGIRDHPESTPAYRVGIPWLLTGEVIERHPVTFLRGSRVVVAHFMESYDLLVQEVDGRYCRALAWLDRIGFVLGPKRALGVEGRGFHQVQLRKELSRWA